MKHFTLLTLCTASIVGLTATSSYADGFTSHYSVSSQPYAEFAENLTDSQKLKLREYLDYEAREPCQNYQEVPEGFVKDGCRLAVIQEAPAATVEETAAAPTELRPVVKSYTIHFDHDKYAIRLSEAETVDLVAEEIKTYEPHEVTIAGHADRSGAADYNMDLSQKRAQSVSKALTEKGVQNRILDQEAFGESDLAVQTDDGVKLEENRRVEIQFRK